MTPPPKKKWNKNWTPKPRTIRVSRHDHVGAMIFIDGESACCKECGQLWDWDDNKGWIALAYTGGRG